MRLLNMGYKDFLTDIIWGLELKKNTKVLRNQDILLTYVYNMVCSALFLQRALYTVHCAI